MKWRLIAQSQPDAPTLGRVLGEEVSGDRFDCMGVAVAYATLQGVKAIELALNGFMPTSRWVIGLDDAISQPEAIEYLLSLKGSEVRLASMSPERRFHPKLYCFWSSDHVDRCVSAIGSGNMTLNGLRHNGETAVFLIAESQEETNALRAQWTTMWDLGEAATSAAIDSYRKFYRAARRQRRKVASLGVAPPEPEPSAPVEAESGFDGDPANATAAWLEAGSPSAGGRDLEFPRAMMPFFGLKQSPESKIFRMKDGQRFTLNFTHRSDNQMWRLMFNRSSIHAAIGRDTMRSLTGKNRSDLAIVFRKGSGAVDYEVTMIVIGSQEYEQLLSRSNASSGLHRTRNDSSGRNFGFV